MSKEKLAQDIIRLVGGSENISFLRHCITRLRFDLKESNLARPKEIEKLSGVAGTRFDGEQFQVIIGTDVDTVYKEIIKITCEEITSNTNSSNKEKKKNTFTKIMNIFSDVFVPIMPAIIAAGMLKGLLSVLEVGGWVSLESSTYQIFVAISSGAFYFLPILIAISASNRFGLNQYLGAAIAGSVLYPNFTTYMLEAQEQGINVSFLSLPVVPASYASQVIPMFIMIFIASYIEKWIKKVAPKAIAVILVPTIVLLITVPLFLIAIGPFGTMLSGGITVGIDFLFTYGGVFAGIIFGMIAPFLVITGAQHTLVPIILDSIATKGGDYMLPMFATNNISQGAAALAVFLLVKKHQKDLRSTSFSSGITGLFGVAEPAMYGINLVYRKPFIAAMIGNGIAGGFMMFFDVKAYTYVKSGLQGIPMLIGETFLYGIIGFGIALFGTILITYFMGITVDEESTKDKSEKVSSTNISTDNKKIDTTIFSPIVGKTTSLSNVDDPTFSQEMLGKGIAIEPHEGKVTSPVDGTITVIMPSKHAVGITSDNGVEVLIHVGLDTVKLDGKHFESFVEKGDKVKKGDKLLEFNIEGIHKEGYPTITPVIITNTSDYASVEVNENEITDSSTPVIVVKK